MEKIALNNHYNHSKHKPLTVGLLLLVCALTASCGGRAHAPRQFEGQYGPMDGKAVWYGTPLHGRQTASREYFDKTKYTAAHPSLPFGSWVRVTNRRNNRYVDVRINDRGPNGGRRDRIIDVSERAAEKLGMLRAGVVKVHLTILSLGPGEPQQEWRRTGQRCP